MPLLQQALNGVAGDVLELGAGDGSTEWLHKRCKGLRNLLTLDNDVKWIDRFKHLESPTHQLLCVADWATAPIDREWGIVLVDHAPGERRIVEIARLAKLARVMIIHDTETVGAGDYKFESIWRLFEYIKHDTQNADGAQASVVSNFLNVAEWSLPS